MAQPKGTGEEADITNDTAVIVEVAVKDEGGGGLGQLVRRCGETLNDLFEQLLDALAGFGADEEALVFFDTDDVFDFIGDAVGLGGGQVDLVDDGDDFEVGVDGEISSAPSQAARARETS